MFLQYILTKQFYLPTNWLGSFSGISVILLILTLFNFFFPHMLYHNLNMHDKNLLLSQFDFVSLYNRRVFHSVHIAYKLIYFKISYLFWLKRSSSFQDCLSVNNQFYSSFNRINCVDRSRVSIKSLNCNLIYNSCDNF